MTIPFREQQDNTVARLAPEPGEEPELYVDLKKAYLREKALSQQLKALSSATGAGWEHPHMEQVSNLGTEDESHARILSEVLTDMDTFTPERPETSHSLLQKGTSIHTALLLSMEVKKDLEIGYIRAASLAALEGRESLAHRLENIASEEARGRRDLLQVLTRCPVLQSED